MTKNQCQRDNAVMMSSAIPSAKYSCSGSPDMLANGSTAIEGRSGSGNASPWTGAAFCWGFNGSGQLGANVPGTCTDESGFPFQCTDEPTAVSGGLSFASISAATQHVCGLTTGGIAYCWGLGSEGQLGDGSKGDQVFTIQPVRVAGQPGGE